MHPIPVGYSARVYAGVLGKLIGVYLGRPFEQWSHEAIERKLGEVRYYVHEQLGFPLIVADDDITGTFTFFRALTDRACDPDLTAAQIGDTWLNYIIENRTILWWGGIGFSTEHTAWARLASGVRAPASGSARLNGIRISEQIGAQIFIDAWGLVNPGDPARAADFARRAASVSHDGEAVAGAQAVAAMVAAAFDQPEVDAIIAAALDQIPSDSLIRRMADDIREWHAEDPADWRRTLARITANYGYDRHGGGCHIIPNHALIHLALRHGAGDFHESQMIVNTAGWDTDCNAANVGCILGVAGGLGGLDGGPDWRGPVADRLLLPTAEGGAAITDAVRESYAIINAARTMRGMAPEHPKAGARFHFSLPGSVQGFVSENPEALRLENEGQALACRILKPGVPLRAFTATFTPKETLSAATYAMAACPTLHPGQTVRARWIAPASNPHPIPVALAVQILDESLATRVIAGPSISPDPGASGEITWTIPSTEGFPIAAIGFEITPPEGTSGTLLLDSLDWKGAPTTSLMPSVRGSVWSHAWVRTMDGCIAYDENTTITIHHSRAGGTMLQGSRDWRDYTFRAKVEIRLAESFGLLIRAQGLRRHYSLRLDPSGTARIVKACDGEVVLAEAACPWILDRPRELEISAQGDLLRTSADGTPLLEARDSALEGGAAGFLLARGGAILSGASVAATR
jgi:ADP-ribosylglycohydrolase